MQSDTQPKASETQEHGSMSEHTLRLSGDDHGDVNIVDWDGPDDAEMPLNWSLKKKYTNTTILSVIALAV
jgi:hypothetical protein